MVCFGRAPARFAPVFAEFPSLYLMRTKSSCCGGAHRCDSLNKSGAAALLEPRTLGRDLDAGELRNAAQQLDELEQPGLQHVGELAGLGVAAERVHGVGQLLVAQRKRVACDQRQARERREAVELVRVAPSSARLSGGSFQLAPDLNSSGGGRRSASLLASQNSSVVASL